jgi:signal transduction histidine kinase
MHDLGIHPGVQVYRDGIRVEPYGDPEDDWLGVQARKASRQGYAAIRPNTLYGFVEISKITNSDLIDMTNRQGLVENQAYEEFVAHMRAEFRRFADIVFKEFVEPEWQQAEDRAVAMAERTMTDRDVLIRDIVHELRQPISSLGTEMRNLDFVLENDEIPDATKEKLLAIRGRAARHLSDINEIVRVALEDPIASEIEPVSIYEVVSEAIATVEAVAATSNASVVAEVGDRIVLARRAHLRRAIVELLRNAIQAPRRRGVTAHEVTVTSTSRDGSVVLRVADNGIGVDEATASRAFKEPISKKGRQGEGLIQVRDLLATFSARAHVANPGEEGAAFEIVIPSMGEVRKILR